MANFLRLHAKGKTGVLDYAFISLSFGSIVAAFHLVWPGLPLIVTLIGWAKVTKGASYFAFPGFGLRQLKRVGPTNAHLFRWPGAVFLMLTVLLGWRLLLT